MAQLETKIKIGKITPPRQRITISKSEVSAADWRILEEVLFDTGGGIDLQTEHGVWNFMIKSGDGEGPYVLGSNGSPR